ncbi:eukaryotic nucleoporin family protein [Hirsutella rhossiliensis]|uniref:Nuclear pore complex scaffold nucleoporin n=1 Tax=Hirsutella rhossiliensis TaxID=111463 RepID=A0A9P8MPL0_9HYPO|nr:nuclear pore complex scaffold nucleoporin [Hirsutella rhossiliensis]KAH0959102.1 nuclear pore complex scaffold nucleoporin [Hirsutella rhossiliensis]
MAEFTTLDALQALHRELVALSGGYGDGLESLDNDFLVKTFEKELDKLWEHPSKKDQSRSMVKSGKISLDGSEYTINDKFQQDVLLLSDEIDLDELQAARCLLDSQDDPPVLGRTLLECGIIRFHQQRKYLLDALRLLLEFDSAEEDVDESSALESIKMFVAGRLFQAGPKGAKRHVSNCMSAMARIKALLQNLGDKIAAAQTLNQGVAAGLTEEMETIEFSRLSLMQQHELLGVILCRCIEKRQAEVSDFLEFVSTLKKADRYDALLVHLVPAIGAYISAFGSTEGGYDLIRVRELNNKLLPPADDSTWPLPQLHAAFRAWWLAEYSGFYLDDPPESAIPPNTDLDEEDRHRSKQFLDSLKDGAFDFLLSVAGDVKSPEWHDSVRVGMRNWLQRKSSAFPSDSIQFSGFFQLCLMTQLEVFVDAFISNLPDVLRKLRVDEDEQRQLSQAHEQDLDLERFLLTIAYSYEGRPDAAASFWSDPDSNLAGFMHWASRRASTPLVTAFCEMLQAISGNEECATAAHEFLLDEGHQSSGKLRRSQSLTWTQIFKELDFFSDKTRQKPTTTQPMRYRGAKSAHEQMETEPESAMMLESYLRLMTKLASESETARVFLLQNPGHSLVDMLYELASSPIPPRLRGCTFMALKALMARKSTQESHMMWSCLENWVTGGYASPATGHMRQSQSTTLVSTERILDEMSTGFEDPESFIQLLLALVSPARDSSPLNDSLPFPENLGSSSRYPGIEVYVDFVMGLVLANKSHDLQDKHQVRTLRLSCLEFILTCLATFNEDLIVIANETNLKIDSVIAATDLATYVCKHPFARVMEWMFNDKVMRALFSTIHQDAADVGSAAPDSPLILGILRAVEVITKVLDLEATYQNLVRPLIKVQASQTRLPIAHTAYASFQDGLVTRLNLVVDLGVYCGIGHPDLTLACLKLLEKMSSSSKIAATWTGSSRLAHRNKAIVALEANGEHEAISRSFGSELMAPLESRREANSPNYITKIYILDFLLQCLQLSPKEPTIAHLLLGFKCGVDSLSVENNGAFVARTSLFHSLVRLLLEIPSGDSSGMRQWLIALKSRAMRILHILWTSPLSATIVINELRENEFLFHLLIRESVIRPDLPWEEQTISVVHFPVTDGAPTLVDFLTLRSLTLEYIATELCMISQGRMPGVKRRIYDALNGQVVGDGNQTIETPTAFDLFDFLLPEGLWDIPPPPLQFYKDLDVSSCLETDADSNLVYNVDRAKEILLLKRGEQQGQGTIIAAQDLVAIEKEEAMILEFLLSTNRQKQIATLCLKVLKSWTRLLLIMVECNDFKGTAQTSFFLQALQAVLPSLEAFASDRPEEALELARLARVLLFRLDLAATDAGDKQSQAIGNLVSDKLYQLFQICLQAIGKWAGSPVLRSVYYEICYRYLTGMSEQGPLSSSRPKTTKTIQVYGERLINVICDDAYCSQASCQTAAFILLNALVHVGRQEDDNHVIETLNRLNFIGILVDSLRNIMQEWHEAFASGHGDQQNYQNARLALLLEISQSRAGAKYILYANVFRTLETSGLFTADPELQSDSQNSRALEQHYDLLAKVVRIIAAALLSRGSHNAVQGRKFLTDHRMLVTHTLKRSAGIGGAHASEGLEERIGELADGLMVVIAATGFLEFEDEVTSGSSKANQALFH